MRTSTLETSKDRFLSLLLRQTLDDAWLTSSDVLQEFPPETLMGALESAAGLRARLLIEAAGVHARIAPKKSTGAAAEDLRIALEEGVCTPNAVLEILTTDELVRYLDKSAIWEFLTRDQFWLQDSPRAQARMLFALETGIKEELLDLHRLVRAITPEQLAKDLPRELIERALAVSIHSGLDNVAYSPKALLETLALPLWLEHLSLAHVWDCVIKGELAPSAGLGGFIAQRAPVPHAAKGRQAKDTLVASPAPPSALNDEESAARTRAVETLRGIDRLPPNSDKLRSPVLLGLEAMYADLLATSSDDDRAERIRDAFPNPAMLAEALYAMASCLDPRLTEESLRERGADTNSIIQLVLFEERRRASRAHSVSPSSPPPAVAPSTSVPPPASSVAGRPGASIAPPLPPQATRNVSGPPPPLPVQARTRSR